MTDLNPYEEGLALELQEAKDCIKALQKALKDQSSVSDRLAEQLATCEKYRDAYAECDRIGTQAVRDLETKLAKTEVINKLLTVIAILNDPNDERFPEAVDLAERFSATLAEIKGGNDAESNL
jgi:uncharacterized protein involved in exopolysaccharide biosynthesis